MSIQNFTVPIDLADIQFNESHSSLAVISHDNFQSIKAFIEDLICRMEIVEGNQSTSVLTAEEITEMVMGQTLFVTEIEPTQTDGTTEAYNDINVTRNGTQFVIQHPTNKKTLLSALRTKSGKVYATSYNKTVNDLSNQIILDFTVLPSETLEFVMFGWS